MTTIGCAAKWKRPERATRVPLGLLAGLGLVMVCHHAGCGRSSRTLLPGAQAAGSPASCTRLITINRSVGEHPSLKTALDDLRQTVAWALDVDVDRIGVGERFDSIACPQVLITGGGSATLRWVDPPVHGYAITSNGRSATVVVGDSVMALTPGIYRLIERIRVAPDHLHATKLTSAPAFQYRMLTHSLSLYKYDTYPRGREEIEAVFQRAVAAGYNLVAGAGSVSRSALFRDVDIDLLPPGSPGWERTQRNRDYLCRFCRRAGEFGLRPVAGGDEFEYPAELVHRPYFRELIEQTYTPGQLEATFGSGRVFCYASSRLWGLHDAKYDEILGNFPEVGAVMVRLGENYSHLSQGQYIGNGIYAFDQSRLCDACRHISYEQRIADLINRTARIVCGRHGRLYLHRTWDTQFDRFHASPEVFERIARRLDLIRGLLLVTKYPVSDFWRHSALNPTIELPGPSRIVEFQCAREYEGKGAYPNWLGTEYARAYRYARDCKAVGVSNWHHGGGWGGPFPEYDLWNEANWYLVDHLAWQPELEPDHLAAEWAAIRFGPRAAPLMVELLILSEEAVEKFRYFGCYGPDDARPLPVHDWIRDDLVRGRKWLSQIASEHPSKLVTLIAEKQEAVRLIDRMIDLLDKAGPDIRAYAPPPPLSFEPELPSGEALVDYVRASLEYQRTLASAVRDLVTTYFLFLQWQEDSDSADPGRIREAADRWNANWRKHLALCARQPAVATPYHDDGMQATIDYVRACLDRGLDIRFLWQVVGPLSNPDNRNFDTPFPPERLTDVTHDFRWQSRAYTWRSLPYRFYRDGMVDFDALYNRADWAIAYAFARFKSETEQPAQLRAGSDDGIKVWLNGRLVHELDRARAATPDEDVVGVRLRAGTNTLLVKNADRVLGWGFYLRLSDATGQPLQSVTPLAP